MVGIINPAPTPCITLNTMTASTFHDRDDNTDPAKNTASENIYTRLPPKRLTAHPENGMVMPITRIYPVIAH